MKSKPSRPWTEKALETQLKRIAICEERIAALTFALYGLRDVDYSRSIAEFRGQLFDNLNDAFRALYMLGVINPKAHEKAKAAARRFHLKERMGIMNLLDINGQKLPGWYTEDEEAFRKELREALAEKEDEHE